MYLIFYVLCVWCICNVLGLGGALATSSGSTSVFGFGNQIDDVDGISKLTALLNSFGIIIEFFSDFIALNLRLLTVPPTRSIGSSPWWALLSYLGDFVKSNF